MRFRQSDACSAPRFFDAFHPSLPGSEARILTLASYSENELATDREASVRLHVEQCGACARFLQDLEKVDGHEVSFAACPSSEALDRYLFNRHTLHSQESVKIETHLKECPLCSEEMEWLKGVDPPQVIPFQTPGRWMKPALAAAAVVIVALTAFLIRGAEEPNADKLRALAVIKAPDEINFAELEGSSETLDSRELALYEQAVADFRGGRFELAAGKFGELLQSAPLHSGATFLLGYSYYKMNQAEKAFELCDRAEKMEPHSYERCMLLVNLALKTGHFRRAYAEITALHHGSPEHPEIHDMYLKITSLMQKT